MNFHDLLNRASDVGQKFESVLSGASAGFVRDLQHLVPGETQAEKDYKRDKDSISQLKKEGFDTSEWEKLLFGGHGGADDISGTWSGIVKGATGNIRPSDVVESRVGQRGSLVEPVRDAPDKWYESLGKMALDIGLDPATYIGGVGLGLKGLKAASAAEKAAAAVEAGGTAVKGAAAAGDAGRIANAIAALKGAKAAVEPAAEGATAVSKAAGRASKVGKLEDLYRRSVTIGKLPADASRTERVGTSLLRNTRRGYQGAVATGDVATGLPAMAILGSAERAAAKFAPGLTKPLQYTRSATPIAGAAARAVENGLESTPPIPRANVPDDLPGGPTIAGGMPEPDLIGAGNVPRQRTFRPDEPIIGQADPFPSGPATSTPDLGLGPTGQPRRIDPNELIGGPSTAPVPTPSEPMIGAPASAAPVSTPINPLGGQPPATPLPEAPRGRRTPGAPVEPGPRRTPGVISPLDPAARRVPTVGEPAGGYDPTGVERLKRILGEVFSDKPGPVLNKGTRAPSDYAPSPRRGATPEPMAPIDLPPELPANPLEATGVVAKAAAPRRPNLEALLQGGPMQINEGNLFARPPSTQLDEDELARLIRNYLE